MATREDYIYYARLAEQGERYEDMIKYMKIVSDVSEVHNTRCVSFSKKCSFMGKTELNFLLNRANNFET